MIKRLLISILLVCLLPLLVQGAGITLWSMADQVVDIDESVSVAGRLGYYFGGSDGGLEIAVGSTWHLKDKYPQVMSLLVIERLPDLIDPDNSLPACTLFRIVDVPGR